jgi:RNA polymerase sigma-70 factor (ECF subfamily)
MTTLTHATVLTDEPAEKAIPQLLRDHGDQIFALGMQLCGNRQDAEDLVQETFLRAFRGWDRFEGRSKPSTWLYAIATRTCKRLRRKRAGEPQRMESLTALLPSGEEMFAYLPSNEVDPLGKTMSREARDAVERGISSLPLHFRIPLVLKELMELSIAEVSDVLGIKEATVKTRVHRGRLLLRRELSTALPKKRLPPPDHAQSVCLTLIQAKQEALDRGAAFPVAQEEICERCRAVFQTLDATGAVCRQLGRGQMPDSLRRMVESEFSGPRGRQDTRVS